MKITRPDPKGSGEKLHKARMDAGLFIKELTALIGTIKNTVTN